MDLGNSQEKSPVSLVLAFFDAGGFIAAAPTSPTANWTVTGAGALIVPAADGMSAIITPASTGQITVGVTVSGSGFSASDSATVEVVSGVAVSVKIQLAPAA